MRAGGDEVGHLLGVECVTGQGPAKIEPWRSLLKENSTGPLPSNIPVFLAQGTDDQIIRPEVTRDYMTNICNAGDKVKMISLPNIGHGRAAQGRALSFGAVDAGVLHQSRGQKSIREPATNPGARQGRIAPAVWPGVAAQTAGHAEATLRSTRNLIGWINSL